MLEFVVSQNVLYVAPHQDVFKILASTSPAIEYIVIENHQLLGLQIFPHLVDETLVKSAEKLDFFAQQFIVTGSKINRSLVESLIAISSIDQWAIGHLAEIVGVFSVELSFTKKLSDAQYQQLLTTCCDAKLDVNEKSRFPTLTKPGLVVLDMDSTSITIECIDEIAKLANVGEQVAEITELAMQGKLDFAQSLRSRVSKLEGIELSLLDKIANNLPLMPGMKELVEQFKHHQWKVAIASGGFTYFADNLKVLLSLDDAVSNQLGVANGRLTGEVEGQIVDAQVKADTVEALSQKYGIDMSQTIAIGDGANDLKMMDKAALGIAFHAKALVQQQADVALNQGDLRSVIALLSRS
jgi:phosphoserine phosphatase